MVCQGCSCTYSSVVRAAALVFSTAASSRWCSRSLVTFRFCSTLARSALAMSPSSLVIDFSNCSASVTTPLKSSRSFSFITLAVGWVMVLSVMVGNQVYHRVFSIALSFNARVRTSLAKCGVRTLILPTSPGAPGTLCDGVQAACLILIQWMAVVAVEFANLLGICLSAIVLNGRLIIRFLILDRIRSMNLGFHNFLQAKHIPRPGRRLLFSQQFRYRLQLLHMLRHYFRDDDDRNAEQHAPHTPEPPPEQQRDKHGSLMDLRDFPGHPGGDERADDGGYR